MIYFLKGNILNIPVIQYGITKEYKTRLAFHKRNSFYARENEVFLYFMKGTDAWKIELEIKRKLKEMKIPSLKNDSEIYPFSGFTESFREFSFQTDNLKKLIEMLGINLVSGTYEWKEYSGK